MAHRGPDASGEWSSRDGSCWFGHVRLSILELTDAGSQPMLSASGRTAVAFNGEIYNHMEVRRSLRQVAWRGHSDTETLVEAWEQEGARCLEKLRGMFAFAVYDIEAQKLDLVRDRLGIKPLYFRKEADGGISFGSEVRVLNGGRRPHLGDDALCTYLTTGHLPPSGEMGEGFCALPAGSLMQVDARGGSRVERWWPAGSLTALQFGSRDEAVRQLRELLEDSVREHLLADVPVAVFLSGGTDSSVISVAAARVASEPLRTFSVGFPQKGLDERPIARGLAKKIGARHTEIEVRPEDCIRWIVEGVEVMDLPSADAVNSFIVSHAVRNEGLKVALSGLGGDELFGGYPSFSDVPKISWLRHLPRNVTEFMVGMLPLKFRAKLEGGGGFDAYTLALMRRRWWTRGDITGAGLSGEAVWPELPVEPLDGFASVSWAEMLGYMDPMLLRDSDQMSMAVSLELRVPFLDHRLVEFAVSVPERFKRGGVKRLLVDAFIEDLPREVWDRPRQGFVLPMDEWMRGPLKEFSREGLELAKRRLDAKWVDGVAARFERGELHWTRLWQLVVLGHYMRG
jgi:asparagine synthase (glutamine-hydrolysing)